MVFWGKGSFFSGFPGKMIVFPGLSAENDGFSRGLLRKMVVFTRFSEENEGFFEFLRTMMGFPRVYLVIHNHWVQQEQ